MSQSSIFQRPLFRKLSHLPKIASSAIKQISTHDRTRQNKLGEKTVVDYSKKQTDMGEKPLYSGEIAT